MRLTQRGRTVVDYAAILSFATILTVFLLACLVVGQS